MHARASPYLVICQDAAQGLLVCPLAPQHPGQRHALVAHQRRQHQALQRAQGLEGVAFVLTHVAKGVQPVAACRGGGAGVRHGGMGNRGWRMKVAWEVGAGKQADGLCPPSWLPCNTTASSVDTSAEQCIRVRGSPSSPAKLSRVREGRAVSASGTAVRAPFSRRSSRRPEVASSGLKALSSSAGGAHSGWVLVGSRTYLAVCSVYTGYISSRNAPLLVQPYRLAADRLPRSQGSAPAAVSAA